jgi:2-polyprenyl-3-methyl-5-hydroxy-6-metoxy-1,4-benzoquinol methylase
MSFDGTASPALELSKETVGCLLCGGARTARLHAALPGVVRCVDCGFVYTSPRITREAASRLYTQAYFESHASQQLGYDNYVSDRELVERTFNRRLDRIERRLGVSQGRVLDVGCATGFFLVIAQKRGWQAAGAEISEYCCRYAREHFGLDLFNGRFEDYPVSRSSFDLVTMWDYLEHSFVPDADLRKAYELLKPGGAIAIATPDLSSFPARVFADRWIGFKEHEHLYYFTKKNLSGLLEKQGFRILDSCHAGKYISASFFAKRAGSYSPALGRAIDSLTRFCGLANRSFYCNPFDIIYLLAQKPGNE